jgi:hypothetical protein
MSKQRSNPNTRVDFLELNPNKVNARNVLSCDAAIFHRTSMFHYDRPSFQSPGGNSKSSLRK